MAGDDNMRDAEEASSTATPPAHKAPHQENLGWGDQATNHILFQECPTKVTAHPNLGHTDLPHISQRMQVIV